MAAGLLIFPDANPSRDRNGARVLSQIAFYNNGTITPKTVYADAGLTTPLSNPVVSDSLGTFPAIWADTTAEYTAVWVTSETSPQTRTLDDFMAATSANQGIYDATVVVYNDTVGIKDDTQDIYDDAVALYGSLTDINNAVTAAQTSATNSANSATASATSATNSANSATASANSATSAANQVTLAAAQVTLATTQAGNAATSATNAANSVNQAKATSASVLLNFSTTTTDSDPGSGNVRLNNTDPTLATFIYVDNLDQAGNDQQVFWDSLDDSTSTVKGTIYFKEGASSKLAIYVVTGGVVNGTGYRKIPVSYVSGTGTAFTNAATIGFNFTRNGDTGSAATIGYVAKTSGYTVTAADWGKVIDCTSGTFTLTYTSAATLGAGFYNYIRNSGTGVITGPTADGAVITLNPGDEVIIEGDGSTFHALMLKRAGWTLFRTDTVSVAVASLAVTSIPQSYAGLAFEANSLSVTNSTRSFQIEVSNNNGTNYSTPVAVGNSIITGTTYNGMIFCPHYRAESEVGLAFFNATATREGYVGSNVIPVGLQHSGGMNAARFSFNLDNIAVGSVIKTWVKN